MAGGNSLISVIIPSYNEAANIGRCIRSIRGSAAAGQRVELLVVDNHSTDDTRERARAEGAVVRRSAKRSSISHLRNLGAEAAQGGLLLFLDADMLVPENFLRAGRRLYDEGFEGLLGFHGIAPPEAGWIGRIWNNRPVMARRQPMTVSFLPGRNIFCLGRVFREIGGFNESLTTAEDKDFCLRAAASGYESIMLPHPVALHLGYEKTLREFIRKEYWRQSCTLRLAREEQYSLRSLRNPAISAWHLLFLLATPLLTLAGGPAAAAAAFCWFLPTLAYTARFVGGEATAADLCGLAFLSFLRWNVAGVALVVQFLRP